jgi:non-ribosomal peptide synthetase component F
MQGENLRNLLAYWKKQLGDHSLGVNLPTDYPRGELPSYRTVHQVLLMPNALYDALKDVSREVGSTMFMTLLAGLQVLLRSYTGEDDIFVYYYITTRPPGTEMLIGEFSQDVVLRVNLDGDPDFRELIDQIRQAIVGAHMHTGMLTLAIAEALGVGVGPSRIGFTFGRESAVETLELPEITVSPVEYAYDVEFTDIWLLVQEHPAGLFVDLSYKPDLFKPATIKRLLENYERLLQQLVADPQQRVSQWLSILE